MQRASRAVSEIVLQALVASSLGSCFPLQPSAEARSPADTMAAAANLWCVSNAAATFTVIDAGADKPSGVLYSLKAAVLIVEGVLRLIEPLQNTVNNVTC
jgi:hypothetical protein